MTNHNINDDNDTSKKGHLPYFLNGNEWVKKKFPPVEFVLDHILPVGTALLSGRPKLGKSWLALTWIKQVALQGEIAICYSFEDSEQRLHKRLELCGLLDEQVREYVYSCAGVSAGLSEANEVFAKNLEQVIQQLQPRLVVVDTLGHIKNIGREDYAKVQRFCKQFSPIAHNNNCAIVFVTHDRKGASANHVFEDIHGSVAYTGSMDTLINLKQADNSSRDLMMNVTGKDITLNRPVRLSWKESPYHEFTMEDNLVHELGTTQQAIFKAIRLWTDHDYRLDVRQNFELMGFCEYSDRISQTELSKLLNEIVKHFQEFALDELSMPYREGGEYTKQEISRACGKLIQKGYIVRVENEGGKSKYYRHNPAFINLGYNDKNSF